MEDSNRQNDGEENYTGLRIAKFALQGKLKEIGRFCNSAAFVSVAQKLDGFLGWSDFNVG